MRMTLFIMFMVCGMTSLAEENSRLNVIAFSASAQTEVANDQIEITLTIEKQDRRAADLAAAVNADMQWAIKIAAKTKQVDAQTRNYRTDPRYDNTGTVIGWRATQTLQLTSTDVEAATALATSLQERLLIKSMQFRPTKSTVARIEDELTVRALQRFREKADMIRSSMGMDTYDVIEIHVGQHNPPPRPVYQARMAMAMESAPSVAASPGTSDLVVSVNGRIQLR